MAPFSKIEHAIYYDDSEEEVVSLDGQGNLLSTPSSSTLVRKSSISSSSSSSSIGTSSIKSASSSSSSVSFATDVAVYAILHINDYSLAERRDSWYGAEEMRQLRQEWKSVVQAMEYTSINSYNNVDDNDDSSICVRGLEGKTYLGKQRRREARSASLEVVLNEQWYQGTDHYEGANNDPITIAMAYHELTYPMQVEAYQKAQQDAHVVGQSLSAENDNNKPRKFDFRTVRAKYFAHNNISHDEEDSDATIMTCTNMTYNMNNASNLLLCRSRNDTLRKRLSSCLFPLTSKRYARSRHSPTAASTPNHHLADM